MNKQRKFILLASVTGIIATFLPWIDVVFENYNAIYRPEGITFLSSLIVCAVFSILGDASLILNKIRWTIVFVSGIISLIMIGIFFLREKNELVNVFSYGFYIALLASIGVILATYIFKTHGENH